jgi:hypothetical protein
MSAGCYNNAYGDRERDARRMRALSTCCQRGQALTEFIVVGLTFLVPLFLLLPMLAEVISARQDVEVAARYASWERTVWNIGAPDSYPDQTYAATTTKSDSQIAQEIDRRIFSPSDRQVATTQSDNATGLKPFMLLSQPASPVPAAILALNTASGVPGYAASSSSDSEPDGVAKRIAPLSIGFHLNRQGLVQSQLDVNLIQFSWLGSPFNTMAALAYHRSNTLFTDAWNPGGSDHAISLIQNVVPEHYLDTDGVHRIQNLVGASPIRKEIRYPSLDLGYVTIDPVPASRLSAQ